MPVVTSFFFHSLLFDYDPLTCLNGCVSNLVGVRVGIVDHQHSELPSKKQVYPLQILCIPFSSMKVGTS